MAPARPLFLNARHCHPRQPAKNPNSKALLAGLQANNEQRPILATLREHGWNMARSARALGVSRATLYEKTRKHGISRA